MYVIHYEQPLIKMGAYHWLSRTLPDATTL